MHKHLMDRHKQWIMKGWHAMCLSSSYQPSTNRPQQAIPPEILIRVSGA
jgi:hypothetical protein